MNRTKLPRTDGLLLLGFCAFLFFYGLGNFGLVGADEPRYAQVAREMLQRHDWITPVLDGKPWLEKPVLYYWQAMLAFRVFGVTDWAARLPGAVDATLLVLAVYWFLRRLRPGYHLDGALITAATAGIVGFARAASTDMPLAMAFTGSMLAWFGWFETRDRKLLFAFYAACALGMLAKGPVAPVLATLIIVVFAAVSGELRSCLRTLWLPGIALFFAIALPWYIAVQIRNPEFLRVFIVEHNLERFGTNLYHHVQPFWFYVPVLLLSWIPWTVFAVIAFGAAVRGWFAEKRQSDPLEVFLLIWVAVLLVFFSISKSKLPGYVLPALPAGSVLLAERLRKRIAKDETVPLWLALLHGAIASAPLFAGLMLQYIVLQHRIAWTTPAWIALAISLFLTVGIAVTLRLQGLRALRFVTLVAVVIAVAAILRIGSPALNAALSARPVAAELSAMERAPRDLAVFRVPRELEYGLQFYENRHISRLDPGQVPTTETLVVAAAGLRTQLATVVPGRRVSYLGGFAPQHLEYFWIAAAPGSP